MELIPQFSSHSLPKSGGRPLSHALIHCPGSTVTAPVLANCSCIPYASGFIEDSFSAVTYNAEIIQPIKAAVLPLVKVDWHSSSSFQQNPMTVTQTYKLNLTK